MAITLPKAIPTPVFIREEGPFRYGWRYMMRW
jgi:hypothetical protein